MLHGATPVETLFLCQVSVEGVMGNIQASDPDAFGSANFDVVNLRADGQYKVISRESGLKFYKRPYI